MNEKSTSFVAEISAGSSSAINFAYIFNQGSKRATSSAIRTMVAFGSDKSSSGLLSPAPAAIPPAPTLSSKSSSIACLFLFPLESVAALPDNFLYSAAKEKC
jgi:hypothetical protein